MSEPSPKPEGMPDPPPAPGTGAASDGPASGRRGFFGEALREVISPIAGILEKRIQPVLSALETLPQQAEQMSGGAPGGFALDQLHAFPTNTIAQPKTPHPIPERFLRPPGAMDPGSFEQVCSTCGYCVEACPANAIKLDPHGLAGDGFPYIVAADQPCVICDSLACMKACPSGALKLVDRAAIKMGLAAVDTFTCLRNNGEDCTLCLDVCPFTGTENPALVIAAQSGHVRVRKNACTGCGLCESRCPTEPRSITVSPSQGDRHIIIA